MRTFCLRVIAEFSLCETEDDAQRRFDAFREAILSTNNYGITLYRASTLDNAGGFACCACGNPLNRGEGTLCGPCESVMADDLAQCDQAPDYPGSQCSDGTCGHCGRCGGA